MKILVVSSFPFPDSGGIWTYVRLLKRGLEREGHEVDILTPCTGRFCYRLHNDGRTVWKRSIHYLVYHKLRTRRQLIGPDARRFIHGVEIDRYCLELAALALGIDGYDVIHAQDVMASAAMSRVKAQDVPLILTVHGPLIKEVEIAQDGGTVHPTVQSYVRKLEEMGIMSADRAIVSSNWLQKELTTAHPFVSEKVIVMKPGLDIPDFCANMNGDSGVAFERGRFHILCLARLEPIKGHQHLFAALARLKKDRVDWNCFVVGEGSLAEKLKQLAERLELQDHVIFLGRSSAVPAMLRQADACVLPSLQENQPFAVMESQIAGIPIVATAAGGVPEMVVHGETGLLSPVKDSEQLYQNLRTLMNDARLRNYIAANSREFGRNTWSLESVVTRVIDVYGSAKKSKESCGHCSKSSLSVDRGSRGQYVSSAFYDKLFKNAEHARPVQVDKSIWDSCLEHAPVQYVIPDNLLQHVANIADTD